MIRMSVAAFRRELAELVDRVARGERLVLHRRDIDAAALISPADLRLLRRADRHGAGKARKAPGRAKARGKQRVP